MLVQAVRVKELNGETWVQLSPIQALLDLLRVFPSLVADAEAYTRSVANAASRGVLFGPAAGSVFRSYPAVSAGKSLALVLQFDALSVAKNALSAAASSTKKFYVLCMRVANAPYLLRKKAFLLPIAIIPKSTVDKVGIHSVLGTFTKYFERLSEGKFKRSNQLNMYLMN